MFTLSLPEIKKNTLVLPRQGASPTKRAKVKKDNLLRLRQIDSVEAVKYSKNSRLCKTLSLKKLSKLVMPLITLA